MAPPRTRGSNAFRFQSALQERVEHSKYDMTQRLGPHDPEEAALDADEGPETGEARDSVLGVSETAERWMPMGPADLGAGRHARRRRRLRWLLRATVLLLLPAVVQALRRRRG